MACNCGDTIRRDKEHIISLAEKQAILNETDIQVYSWTQRGVGRLYDYEPFGFRDRGIGLVKVIKFRNDKSKDVLQDTKGIVASSEDAGITKRTTTGKTKSGNKKNKRPDNRSDEFVGEGKDSGTTGEVDTDS